MGVGGGHRYINFTFIEAGRGDVRKLVHMAKFGQKTGIFTYFQCNLTYLKQNLTYFDLI